jgi:hypothetical protein
MKQYLSSGCLWLIIGAVVGAIVGVLIHLLNWYSLEIGFSSLARTDYNFIMLALVFALIGAIIVGFLGLILGVFVAYGKKSGKE